MSPNDWHGSGGGAMRHWRAGEKACEACLTTRRKITKGAALDRLRGNPRLVELGSEAHAVIASAPRDQLARTTGLTVHKLSRLDSSGPTAMVNRTTRDRILAAEGRPFWTPIGIQRRLQALHANGWSMRALAAEINYNHPTVLLKLLKREDMMFVRRDMAEMIVAAYERLSLTVADGRGATRARNLAAREGWASPLAWDDIDRDEQPNIGGHDNHADPVVIARILAGDSSLARNATTAERRAVVAGWPGSLADLERLTGWRADRYIERPGKVA